MAHVRGVVDSLGNHLRGGVLTARGPDSGGDRPAIQHSAASLREALGLPASAVRATVEATGTDLHVTVPEGDRLTVDLRGDAVHDADGTLWMTGPGHGHAIRTGFGDGDAIRDGSGNGRAMHTGIEDGDAVRTGPGHGHAVRTGPGHGNAIRDDSGDGHAVRDGFGDGDAIRSGSGSGHAARDNDGNGHAVRDGSGHGGGGVVVLRLPTFAAVLAVPLTFALIGAFIALVSWGLAALVLMPGNRVTALALSVLFWLALIAFITWVLQRLSLAAFMFCMWWMERPSRRSSP